MSYLGEDSLEDIYKHIDRLLQTGATFSMVNTKTLKIMQEQIEDYETTITQLEKEIERLKDK